MSNKHALFEIKNYNKQLQHASNTIFDQYTNLINEYLLHAGDNIKITNNNYFIFIIKRGLSSLKHIFSILLLYTKNLELTVHHCKKAYLYYVEFIGQIGDTSHSYLQLNSKDATLFVYKKLFLLLIMSLEILFVYRKMIY